MPGHTREHTSPRNTFCLAPPFGAHLQQLSDRYFTGCWPNDVVRASWKSHPISEKRADRYRSIRINKKLCVHVWDLSCCQRNASLLPVTTRRAWQLLPSLVLPKHFKR